MTKALHFTRQALPFTVPAAIMLISFAIISSTAFQAQPDALSIGITLDLLLISPLVYLLLVRKRNIPNLTAVPVFLLGVVAASLLLPDAQQGLLNQFKTYAIPVVELTVFTLITLKVRQMIRLYRKENKTAPDTYAAIREAALQVLPRPAAMALATEVSVFFYGLLRWKKRPTAIHEFSYHRESGSLALWGALLFLVIAETSVVHILLAPAYPVAAWVLTILSLYTGLQFLGFVRAIAPRPITVTAHSLELRYSLLGEMSVAKTNIKALRVDKKDLPEDKSIKYLSPIGALEGHNMVLELHEPQQLMGLYGIKRKVSALAFYVDEPQRLLEALDLEA